MEKYGIRGNANNWVRSYLDNRLQFVHYNGCNSDFLRVVCGVPLGSILGPKLFILYINDISNVSEIFKYVLFADDTNNFCSDNNLHNLMLTVNKELKKLCDWLTNCL